MKLTLLPALLAVMLPAQLFAQPCPDYTKGVEVGRLDDAALNELSGLARSSDGGYWAHNDSGDAARIFKLSAEGKVAGTWTLVGIDAVDFEDMANAPCTDGSACLVVADIGNNSRDRDVVKLHRFTEPTGPGAIALIETTSFKYPDGNHDAEAVFAKADAAYVINKDGNQSRLYRVPWNTTEVVTAELITTFTEPLTVTAADLSVDGTRLLVRGYFSIAEFDVSTSFVTGFTSPKYLPFSIDGQGEAITYSGSGGGFITISEATNAVVNHHACVVLTEPEPEADAGFDASIQDTGNTPEPVADMAQPQPEPTTQTDDSCAGFLPLWLLPAFLRRRREEPES